METLTTDIFQIANEEDFNKTALKIFQFQYDNNEVYRAYCQNIGKIKRDIGNVDEIPFFPISFFKTHDVRTTNFEPEIIFTSSGTTASQTSKHFVKDSGIYKHCLLNCFQKFYGNPSEYAFLALLPNYIEQKNSSLIFMMETLMHESRNSDSGYYLYNHKELYEKLQNLRDRKQKTILWGVTFALTDFAENFSIDFPELIVFETGGMKGRRKEIVKEELYATLRAAFGVENIHSEYGMCELMSQAYSKKNNVFFTPPWMQLRLRDEKDPLDLQNSVKTGAVNVIDLANIYTCAFIATDDLGRRKQSGIEILGRLDNSQIRGCNLLVI